ncbi:CU044_5270 family protein [Streptomyces sp. 71268]|uniref:CU044_5270 family protein n=1 Tax=Streptomyces sp. 71268 TaxID=3002640 RepID=UPI0023F9A03C|nr:CU044_5270 family protein [Streptomyces sp. 71268]WEV26704.1 CU044_5270 family protein [Streptomyces sp. 71268]
MSACPWKGDEAGDCEELSVLLPAPAVPRLDTHRHRELREGLVREVGRRLADDVTPYARHRRSRWRRFTTVVVPIVAVVALAVVAVLVRTAGQGRSPEAASGSGEPSAAGLLDQAAAAQAGRPPVTVRPGQYVYVRHLGDGQVLGFGLSGFGQREDWFPARAGASGVIRVTPVTRGEVPRGRYAPTSQSTTGANHALPPWSYARLASLPTDPDALLKKLYEDTGGQGPSRDEAVFELINGVLDATTLEPNLNAALLRAAARLPGTTVSEEVRDGAGRHGVGLTFHFPPSDPTTWVFDPRTLTYLGTTKTALLDVAVVDEKLAVPSGPGTGPSPGAPRVPTS